MLLEQLLLLHLQVVAGTMRRVHLRVRLGIVELLKRRTRQELGVVMLHIHARNRGSVVDLRQNPAMRLSHEVTRKRHVGRSHCEVTLSVLCRKSRLLNWLLNHSFGIRVVRISVFNRIGIEQITRHDRLGRERKEPRGVGTRLKLKRLVHQLHS